jgi:hypothetical protein
VSDVIEDAYLLDNRIVGRGSIVFDTVDELEGPFGLGRDTIVRLVVRKQAPV